ncbi:MAG: amidohydrolase [Coriobacteriales bacterium]|jgi:5-methylthioadenosine/S-adenosylhomocysteine deaminase
MLFENIDILDSDFNCVRGCFVGTRGNKIEYVGSKRPDGNWGDKYDGRGKLLMPGLFNAHGHAMMTLLRGYAENLPLQRWLQEMVWPFEAKISYESALPASRLAIAEMLRFGTVSYSDMYVHDEARVQAVLESGIKCNMSHGVLAFDPDVEYADMPDYAAVCKLIDEANGAGNGKIKVEIGPHAEYDTVEKAIRGMAEQAQELGLGIQVHVSETKSEHEECKERHGGLTPIAYLEKLGVLDSPTTAAHCVWATDEDLQILKEHDATIATCPASNLKLGSGVPDMKRFVESGANVAIGTDGASSNNALNMFRDMYLSAIAHKGALQDPVGIGAREVLRAATVGGAHAQRRDDSGAIEVGKRADLIVLDEDLPWMLPVSDMACNVVYAANGSEVVLTMVDGEVLYDNGEYPTIDVERAMRETQLARDSIVASL